MGLGKSSSHKPAAVRLTGWRAVLLQGQVATSPMAETPKAEEELLAFSSSCPDLLFGFVHHVCPMWDPWHSHERSQEDLEPRGDVWWDLEGST